MALHDDVELKTGGKVVFGAACAVCCVVPVLVIAGVLTLGALIVGGLAIGAAVAIVALAILVGTRRVRSSAPMVRLALFAVGGAGAVAGLWGLSTDRTGAAPVVVVALAALAAAALLTVAEVRTAPR